jgi:Raf kinase inhibitor-like YbhB/YbcL family protein
MAFTLTSPAFSDRGSIPPRYTGDGEDVSPPLEWRDPPAGTKAYALVVDDPDAPNPAKPQRVWVHWVVAGIPGEATSLADAASGQVMPAGSVEGLNDSKSTGYSGPFPPVGRHRYFFTLYALGVAVRLGEGHTKADLLKAIDGHVLGVAQLIGTYARAGSR